MRQTVVIATRCPLMSAPTLEIEQLDELLLGWEAEILEETAPGWYRARSAYGYEGYAPASALCASAEQAAAFSALPKAMVCAAYCSVLAEPNVRSWPVAEATRGALVAPVAPAEESGWVKIALPDGAEGYTKSCYLSQYYKNPCLPEPQFRRAVADAALSYLGSSYRWGGKSPLGIDCSGLAFMAYWLNGVTIFRDARIEPGFPVCEIPRSALKQGDLLYFPGHVAVYLGGGQYVHSTARSGGVVINSLDPAACGYRADLAQSLTAAGSIFPHSPGAPASLDKTGGNCYD